MTCHLFASGIACTMTDEREYRIRVGEREYHFEWGSYVGPGLLNKNGEINARPPHAFLRAASLWNIQGKRIDADGMCVWHEPKQPVVEMRDGRLVVGEPGDEGWDW